MGVDGRPPWPLRRCYRPTWLTAFQLRRFFAIIDWRRPFVWQPASNLTNIRQIECGRIGAETNMAAGSCSATAATAATATTAAAAAYFSAILRLFISRLWLNDGGNNALEIWEQSVVCSKHLRNEDERLKKCLKKKKKKTGNIDGRRAPGRAAWRHFSKSPQLLLRIQLEFRWFVHSLYVEMLTDWFC